MLSETRALARRQLMSHVFSAAFSFFIVIVTSLKILSTAILMMIIMITRTLHCRDFSVIASVYDVTAAGATGVAMVTHSRSCVQDSANRSTKS